MGQSLSPRVFRGEAFRPTIPRTGNEGEGVWRLENLIRRGKDSHHYYEVLGGERNLGEDVEMVALTGTVAVTEDSDVVIGTGTLFLTECSIGQRIIIINDDDGLTVPIFVKQVISDTQYIAWRESTVTLSGQTGWRMPRLFAMDQDRATMLWGNALRLDKGSILAVGDGVLRINGSTLAGSSLTATREPQIALYAPDATYTVFTLGMDEPPAPSLAAVAGGTKGMQGGNYSLVITPAREQTVGFNNPSQRADVTIATNDLIRITFPAMDTANGQNAWLVWGTTFAESLGADLNYLNGPWFFVRMVTTADVSSAGGTYDIEWLDAEIETNEIVSFDNDPPPQALFVELLNYTPTWLSCRGPSFQRGAVDFLDPSPGPFIAPAKPTNIEAAPAGIQFSSSPPETIIGAVSANGRIYLLTPNTLQIAQSTPDQNVPILIRPFWKDGFANPEQVVFVNGNLYGYTVSGPARSVGEGDEIEAEKEWAAYVTEFTDHWTAGHVLTCYFPNKDCICFFHVCDSLNASGFWTSFALLYSLGQNDWVGARRFTNDTSDSIICGVATVGEEMHLLIGGRGQPL
jgi:hypothetical protein